MARGMVFINVFVGTNVFELSVTVRESPALKEMSFKRRKA